MTRILVADDDTSFGRGIGAVLEDAGFEVEVVSDGRRAWDRFEKRGAPDIAVLDWNMPAMDGIEVCRRIRARQSDRYTYVLLLSSRAETEDVTEGLSSGADAYVPKPCEISELLERVRAGARVLEFERKLQGEHERLRSEHKTRAAALETLSMTDELTGLNNRRGFAILAEQHVRLALRRRLPFAILFADLNGLKSINDELGHEDGDRAIREAAGALKRTIRDADILARLGGDEFVVLLDGCTPALMDVVLQRLGSELERVRQDAHKPFRVSLSAGAAFFDPDSPCTIDELIAIADQQMYLNKRRRRNLSPPVVKAVTSASGIVPRLTEPSSRLAPGGLLKGLPSLAEHLFMAWSLRRSDGGAHAQRVAGSVAVLAKALGREPTEIADLERMALLHDVGELALPDELLRRTSAPSAADHAVAQKHAVFGADLLAGVEHEFFRRAANVARHHNERWDGRGYPDGRAGDESPFEARLIGLLDVYDVMRSPEHRPARTDDELRRFFRDERGRGFEPQLVDALLEHWDQLSPCAPSP